MSAPKIEVVSAEFRHFSGTSKAGRPYDVKVQDAYMHKGDKYPEKMEVPVPKKADGSYADPYPPGFYDIAESSYEVRDGRASINAFELKLLRLPDDKPGKA